MCQAIPYPGTEMANVLEKLGWEMDKEWNHYDEITPVFKSPLLSQGEIDRVRREYFNSFFSPSYIIHESLKRDFYSQIMAKTALYHFISKTRITKILSTKKEKTKES